MGVTRNLVLGGMGAIGSELCNHLKQRSEEVINLDLKNGFDLRTDSLDPYEDVDYVWLLAWDVGGAKYLTQQKNQLDIINNNTLICQKTFSFLEKTKLPFMFASSQLAAPDNTYGVTKILGERWSSLLNGQIVRFWNVYGWEEPGEKSHIIPDLIMQGIQQKRINLMTTGEEERQFVYIDDCIKNMLEVRKNKNKITHLTDGKWIKIKELASIIGKLLSSEVVPGTIPGYNNKIDPDASYRDYQWPTFVEEGIEKIIIKTADYLKNRS